MSEATSLSKGEAARLARTIIELQKLKTRIQQVENRYDILDHEYAKICEEVMETLLRKKPQCFPEAGTVSNIKRDPDLKRSAEKKTRAERQTGHVDRPAGYECSENNTEEYFVSQASLEDIILFQRSQKGHERVSGLSPQKVIDVTADAIETGLDKLGDGLIFPIVKMYELVQRLKRVK